MSELKGRLVKTTDEQWNIKAETIRRRYNLNSKSAAMRLALDEKYDKLTTTPQNSEAELVIDRGEMKWWKTY